MNKVKYIMLVPFDDDGLLVSSGVYAARMH